MRRLARKLKLALAGLVGGFAFACSGPSPNEMPPLAPRPEPVQPVPGPADPSPVPGAPDPMDPSKTGPTMPAPADAGAPVTMMPRPDFRSSAAPAAQSPEDARSSDEAPTQSPDDAGSRDAGVLPPVLDALPSDASKRADE